MSRLAAAIDVAAEYAFHLHKEDGVPKDRAIAIGASAVVRAAKANPHGFLTPRRSRREPEAAPAKGGGALEVVGSTLSAISWFKMLFG